MLTIVHLIVGAAIGKFFGNPWLVIPIALISHYILDFIPHSQPDSVKKYKECGFWGCDKKDLLLKAIEPITGIILTVYLICINSEFVLPMILGAFFSFSPDLFLYLGNQQNIKIAKLIHIGKESKWHNHSGKLAGTAVQALILIIALYYLLIV